MLYGLTEENGALTGHCGNTKPDSVSTEVVKSRVWTTYTESFAPVVQWSTVRLVMILASMLHLESRQIDFTQAFTQADVEEAVYMRLPQGWQVDDTDNWCIKLKKNLYGLSAS